MAMGRKKLVKGIAATLVAAVALTVSATATAGCTVSTAHPSARITFEFNSEEYSVDYTLYRNMYPQTVQHFIELADSGFYNGTIIHDYSTNDWVGGGYEYSDDYSERITNSDTLAEYFEQYSKAEKYEELFTSGELTPSVYYNPEYKTDSKGNVVWADKDGNTVAAGTEGAAPVMQVNKERALSTVMGEFKNNIQQVINNGALTADLGSLKMMRYYEKEGEETSSPKVYVTPTSDQIIAANFENNCATSMFSIQTGSSTSYSASNYTVFAQLANGDAETEFENLKKAITDYFENTYGSASSDYRVSANVGIKIEEPSGQTLKERTIAQTFYAPKTAIKIKSVTITKY